MKVVSFTEARKHFKSILDQVNDDVDCTIITRRDANDAVLMSFDHYNGMRETLYLLSNPANAAHLRESIAQYRHGQTTERELIND